MSANQLIDSDFKNLNMRESHKGKNPYSDELFNRNYNWFFFHTTRDDIPENKRSKWTRKEKKKKRFYVNTGKQLKQYQVIVNKKLDVVNEGTDGNRRRDTS